MDKAGEIGSLIPELFYDIISRICPGCFLALCIAYLWYPSFPEHIQGAIKENGILIILFSGYIIGYLISHVSLIVFDILICPLINRLFGNNLNNLIGGYIGDYYFFPRIENMIKITKESNSQEDFRRFRKMLAEKTLLENLFSSLLTIKLIQFFVYSYMKAVSDQWFINGLGTFLCMLMLFVFWLLRMLWIGKSIKNYGG